MNIQTKHHAKRQNRGAKIPKFSGLPIQRPNLTRLGSATENEFPLPTHRKLISIGRNYNCDMPFQGLGIETVHCLLILGDDETYSVKNVSEEGVLKINGEQVHGLRKLSHGDHVQIGQTVFKYSDERQRTFEEHCNDLLKPVPLPESAIKKNVPKSRQRFERAKTKRPQVRTVELQSWVRNMEVNQLGGYSISLGLSHFLLFGLTMGLGVSFL